MKIGQKDLSQNEVLTIAEIGLNHNGDMKLAKDMIQAAAQSKADIVKFQKRTIEDCFQKNVLEAAYDKPTSLGKTYYEHKLKLEFSVGQLLELKAEAERNKIGFMCTPFDPQALKEVVKMGVPAIKIASHLMTNHELLIQAAGYGLPLILSTGMATREEVMAAYGTAKSFYPKTEIALMQCTSSYPADINTLHVGVVKDLLNFTDTVGFSNHCPNPIPGICAVALGARIIEQHFTLSYDLPGPDHKASLLPDQFLYMVQSIKETIECLGDNKKRYLPEEKSNRHKHHRTVIAKVELKKGDILTRDKVKLLAPEDGVPAYYLGMMLGRVINKGIKTDELIKMEDIS